MTASTLLFYICAAALLQLAVFGGIAIFRGRGSDAAVAAAVGSTTAQKPNTAWSGWRRFRVARRDFEDKTNSQCSFYLEPVDGVALPSFKPGQFLTFQLAIADTSQDGQAVERNVIRCYSLSDRPRPVAYRVTIKRVLSPVEQPAVPPGVSSGYFHDHVNVGDVLQLKAPSGHFFIDPDPGVDVVLIAGGIGITPMMSMLRWCMDEQPMRKVHLYYGLRHGGEHAFKQDLEKLAAAHPNFHLNVTYSRADSADERGRDFQHDGYVDTALLRRTLPHGRHQFYVCGPTAMMESLVPALEKWGVPQSDIHFEAFGPASVKLSSAVLIDTATSEAAGVSVQFARSARSLVWNASDASLLDFAERHGVRVDSGCRAGSCGTCETKLISGEVRYTHKPDYDITPGHCLLCVGVPTSAVIIEA